MNRLEGQRKLWRNLREEVLIRGKDKWKNPEVIECLTGLEITWSQHGGRAVVTGRLTADEMSKAKSSRASKGTSRMLVFRGETQIFLQKSDLISFTSRCN